MSIAFNRDKAYETVSIGGKLYLFEDLHVDRSTVPEGLFQYEVGDDDGDGCFARVNKGVLVNFWCTIIGVDPLPEEGYYPRFCSGEYEGAYYDPMTLEEYLDLTEEERNGYQKDTEPSEEYGCFPGKTYGLTVKFPNAEITDESMDEIISEIEENLNFYVNIDSIEVKTDGLLICFTVNTPIRKMKLQDELQYVADEYANYEVEVTYSVISP